MTTMKECLRRFVEVPTSHWLEKAGNLACQNMTVWKVLRKRLCFKPYKMRWVQAFTPGDKVKKGEFCEEMQLKTEEDGFVKRLISDGATFHISGKVNRHNVRIRRAPARLYYKVNVFCAVSREKVFGSFFFTEATVTGGSFLDMLESWVLLQLNTNYDDYFPPPPNFHTNVRVLLNRVLPQSSIGRVANGSDSMTTSFPGSYTSGFFLMEIRS
jgi:hypothetical protein